MIKFLQRLIPGEPAHLAESQLVKLMNGELSATSAVRVRKHLDRCWECRERRERLERVALAFVEYRRHLLTPFLPPPVHRHKAFLLKLDALAESLYPARVSIVRRALHGVGALVPRMAGALAMAAIAALLILLFPGPNPSSAARVLSRAHEAERAADEPGRVVHRFVTVERRRGGNSTAHRIELWRSSARRVKSGHVFDAKGKLLAAESLSADGKKLHAGDRSLTDQLEALPGIADSVYDLPSASAFSAMVTGPAELRLEEQPAVYVLSFVLPDATTTNAVLGGSLTLRRSDLHAIKQSVQVREKGELEEVHFIETSWAQPRENEVRASVFDLDTAAFAPPAKTISAPRLPPVPVSTLQVEALQRMDALNALVLEQMAVQRTSSGGLRLEAVVATEERKRELLRALGSLAQHRSMEVVLKTVQEQLGPPPERLKVESLEASGSAPLGPELRTRLSAENGLSGAALEQEVTRIATRVTAHSTSAQLHALALRRIVEAFTPAQVAAMEPAARQRWRAMIARHASAVQRDIREVRQIMTPLFHPAPGAVPSEVSGLNLSQLASDLAGNTDVVDRAVWNAVGVSAGKSSETSINTQQFWNSLEQAEAMASSLADSPRSSEYRAPK